MQGVLTSLAAMEDFPGKQLSFLVNPQTSLQYIQILIFLPFSFLKSECADVSGHHDANRAIETEQKSQKSDKYCSS